MRIIKNASGQNYIVGGREGMVDVECSANQVVEYRPLPGVNRLYHTNHPLASDDQSIFQRRLKRHGEEKRKSLGSSVTTYNRFETLSQMMGDLSVPVTVERIKEILSTHTGGSPICIDRGTSKLVTLGSVIMELGSEPKFHVAPGPPCSTPYQTYTFQ